MITLILFVILFIYIITNYKTDIEKGFENDVVWSNIMTLVYGYSTFVLAVFILKILWLLEIKWAGVIFIIISLFAFPVISPIIGMIFKSIFNSFIKFIKNILFINIPLIENDFIINKLVISLLLAVFPTIMIANSISSLSLLLSLAIYLPIIFMWVIFIVFIYKAYLKYTLKILYKEYKIKNDTEVTYQIKEALKSNNINKLSKVAKEVSLEHSLSL